MECLLAQDVEEDMVCNQESDEHSGREIHVSEPEQYICHNHGNTDGTFVCPGCGKSLQPGIFETQQQQLEL